MGVQSLGTKCENRQYHTLNQFLSGPMYMCIVARTINAPLGAPISYYRAPNNLIDQVSGHLVPFWKFWSKNGPNSLFLSKRSEFLAQSVVVPEKSCSRGCVILEPEGGGCCTQIHESIIGGLSGEPITENQAVHI